MVPEGLASKWRVGFGGIADEALGSVGIEGKEEWYEEVVGVPERFIGLLADPGMGGSEHHEHAEKHNVTGDTASLGVVYFYS